MKEYGHDVTSGGPIWDRSVLEDNAAHEPILLPDADDYTEADYFYEFWED